MAASATPSVRRSNDTGPTQRGRAGSNTSSTLPRPAAAGASRPTGAPADGGRPGVSRPPPARRGAPLGNTRTGLHRRPPPRGSGSLSEQQNSRREAARDRSEERKDGRFGQRTDGWEKSMLERVAKCGRVSITPGGGVGLRLSGTAEYGDMGASAGFAGLATCGSVWSCPVCAAKIAARRSMDLESVLDWAVEQGHTVGMLTLTARHHRGQSLRQVWDGVQGAWGSVTSGKSWQSIAQDWGIVGWARAVEVTHGDAGWHPHLHVVIVLEGEQPPACMEKLGEAIWPRWLRGLERRGFTALRGPGLDIRCSTDETATGIAAYFTKQLAMEVTGGHGKAGRGNRTPFQILADLNAGYLGDDLDLWHEWQEASQRRRQLTWSQALRKLAGLQQELTDDEVVEESPDDSEDILFMDAATWQVVLWNQVKLLLAAENGGWIAAQRWLTDQGLTGWHMGRWERMPTGVSPPAD